MLENQEHSNKYNEALKRMTWSLGMRNNRQKFWRRTPDGACPAKGKSYSPDAKTAVARATMVIRQLMFGLCRIAVGVKDENRRPIWAELGVSVNKNTN